MAPNGFGSTTAAVDELLRRGQRQEAEKYLDAVVGGHGIVTGQGLVITHPIQPWHCGRQLMESGGGRLEVLPPAMHAIHIQPRARVRVYAPRASVMAYIVAPQTSSGNASDTLNPLPLVPTLSPPQAFGGSGARLTTNVLGMDVVLEVMDCEGESLADLALLFRCDMAAPARPRSRL